MLKILLVSFHLQPNFCLLSGQSPFRARSKDGQKKCMGAQGLSFFLPPLRCMGKAKKYKVPAHPQKCMENSLKTETLRTGARFVPSPKSNTGKLQ
jgi:hypothetical protein